LLALLGAAMLAPGAHAATVKRPPVTWVRGDGSYTKTSRKPATIKQIVIHATDGGSFTGNVWWLSGGHSHASAHYVVARNGEIAQLVHLSDIAWHAGNWKTNAHSIGVEHVGETYDPNGFTLDEYRQSAKLVAWLARRSHIPIDRRHIIGHAEVPDPATGAPTGGSDHHTDPGPYWNWRLYMRLVRRYGSPEPPLRVHTTTIDPGETLVGIVPWRAATKGPAAARVDFLLDGERLWSDHRAPFAFGGRRGWNTTQLPNGPHVLVVRAVGRNGKAAVSRLAVNVRNREFAVTTAGLRSWQRVRGKLTVHANVFGARTTGIGLYVDGRVVSRDRAAPFRLTWNSHRVADGRHRLTVAAEARDGRIAKRRVPVVVHNKPLPKPKPKPKPKPAPRPKPKPKPPAPPVVTAQSLAEGQTVQGPVAWTVQTTGPVVRVEFLLDGTPRGTATAAPWTFAWDATPEPPGPHRATVRAVTADGRTAESTVTVTVAPPAPPPAPG